MFYLISNALTLQNCITNMNIIKVVMWRQNNTQPVELPHPTRIEDWEWSATVSCSEQRISDEIQFLNLDRISIK
ncbi:MAG: hypothetical protein WBP74_10100 [Nitrososphaeraceae archaeon]